MYLVRACQRAGTVQILSGHTLDSFLDVMSLVRNRPKGAVNLCHIAPVKGKSSTGLFHCKNLFYGGAYQNKKFGRRYLGGGLSISHKNLKSKWRVEQDTPANDVLMLVEEFLGDIIPKYLEVAPVRKSKKYQLVEKIVELKPGVSGEGLMKLSYNALATELGDLCHVPVNSFSATSESKYIAYMDGLSRFIEYGDKRKAMLCKLRKAMVVSYMALERVKCSGTVNKYFYVKYEPLMDSKYAYAIMKDPREWSAFKDFIYDAAFFVLQGGELDFGVFRKQMMSYLQFPKSLEELLNHNYV
ncbi:hypothetical protein [Pseudomonas guariconensis]|nr:hypothetical protein [Pseudomonas guariconensis]MBF8751289.1 hypothetical protein [Pseudomonas guariconensis]